MDIISGNLRGVREARERVMERDADLLHLRDLETGLLDALRSRNLESSIAFCEQIHTSAGRVMAHVVTALPDVRKRLGTGHPDYLDAVAKIGLMVEYQEQYGPRSTNYVMLKHFGVPGGYA